MNPNHQIIPGPRQNELRPTGRPSPLEIFQPMEAGQPDSPKVRYLALLRRHRTAVLGIFGGALLLSVVYTLVAHKVYRAQTVLEVTGMNDDFMNSKEVDPTTNQLPVDGFIETQTRLLQSPPVLEKTAETLGATPEARSAASSGLVDTVRKWLNKPELASANEGTALVFGMVSSAKVKAQGASNLIAVTVEGPEPQLTADVANELTHQFIELGEESRFGSATDTNHFLAQQMQDARAKLQASEDALQNYARQAGIVIPSDSQESVAADKLRQIQSDLAKAQSDEAQTRSQMEVGRTSPSEALPEVLDDPTIREEQSRLTELRRQLADLSVTLTPANLRVQELQAQISDLQSQIAGQRNDILRRMSVQNAETARRRQLLDQEYQSQLGVVSDQAAKEVRYNILKRELDANRDIYQSMLQRVKEAGIVAAMRASPVRVASPADKPSGAYRPSLPLNLALGLLCGCVFSTCYILIRERSDESLRMPGETVRHMDVPELAVIPSAHLGKRERIPLASRNLHQASVSPEKYLDALTGSTAGLDKELVKWSQDETMMADAYRSAVTSILLSRRNGAPPRVILITSARPKAGKTTTVANLGISLAEIGRRVLLIDGDLRRPQLGKLFGLQFANGLSDLLQEGAAEATLDSTVRDCNVPGLYVLAGGSEPGNISQLLNSARLDALMETARSQFDFVLIDSPPMMGMADARLLSRNSDGVILICRAGQTSAQQMGEAKRRLNDDGTPVIGTILNDCDLRTEDPAYFTSYHEYARASRD